MKKMRNKTLLLLFTSFIFLSCDNTSKSDKLIQKAWLQKGFTFGSYKAKSIFDEAIEVAPGYYKAYYNKGLSYLLDKENGHVDIIDGDRSVSSNEFKDAVDKFNKVIELNTKLHEVYYYRAIAHYFLKEYNLAIDDIRFYLDNEQYPIRDSKLLLSVFLYKTNHFKELIRLLNNDFTPEALNLKGKSKVKINDIHGAIADFSESIKLVDDEECYSFSKIRFYNNRGIAYVKIKKYEKALGDFNKAYNSNYISKEDSKDFFKFSDSFHGDKGAISMAYITLCLYELDAIKFYNFNYTLAGSYRISQELNNHNFIIPLIYANIYFDKGYIASACEAWSKSGELGSDEAYELIKKYCN